MRRSVVRLWMLLALFAVIGQWVLGSRSLATPFGASDIRLQSMAVGSLWVWVFSFAVSSLVIVVIFLNAFVASLLRGVLLVSLGVWYSLLAHELLVPYEQAKKQFIERALLPEGISGALNENTKSDELTGSVRDELVLREGRLDRFDPETGEFESLNFMQVLMIKPAGWGFSLSAVWILGLLLLPIDRLLGTSSLSRGASVCRDSRLEVRWFDRTVGFVPAGATGIEDEEDELFSPPKVSVAVIGGTIRASAGLGAGFSLVGDLCRSITPAQTVARELKMQGFGVADQKLEEELRLLADVAALGGAAVWFCRRKSLNEMASQDSSVGDLLSGDRFGECFVVCGAVSDSCFLVIADDREVRSAGGLVGLLRATQAIGQTEDIWLIYEARDAGLIRTVEGVNVRIHCLPEHLTEINRAGCVFDALQGVGAGGSWNSRFEGLSSRFRLLLT